MHRISFDLHPARFATIARSPLEAAIAQLGERQTDDLKVPGSILGLGICLVSE